ncbi:MAG: c-di-GMP phosphodiesterase [Spirochaetia bacterium]|nr:c-di-GMP phosphodiesterase [Spirochaetia bacterium]
MALSKFEFNEESINYFHESKLIPLNFFNKTGQILIHQKVNASENEINALLKFRDQGIYFQDSDAHKLKKPKRYIPEGLSDTKLLTEETTHTMVHDFTDIFSELKSSSITSISAKKMKNTVNDIFQKFEKQSDAMTGLVNILELMNTANADYELQAAIKRTVVAMALKTRGMTTQNSKDADYMAESMNNLMVSSMLCDVAYLKMKMPVGRKLNSNEMEYIKNHPIISYLMIAHEDSIDPIVKHNVLLHHRAAPIDGTSNNYPTKNIISQKLATMYQEYSKNPDKRAVANSIARTLNDLKQDVKYDEDINILALASEFASLTTDVPWRKSFSPVIACKMILNNSFFTYSARVTREFLDLVAVSLCDNNLVLKTGDFVIIALDSSTGNPYFELCKIIEISRLQSRPSVERIGSVNLTIKKEPKLTLSGFDYKNIVFDKRNAKYNLENDLTRRMIYVVDQELNPELFDFLNNKAT